MYRIGAVFKARIPSLRKGRVVRVSKNRFKLKTKNKEMNSMSPWKRDFLRKL